MAQDKLIHCDYCLTPHTRINNSAILIRGDKFLAVGGFTAFSTPEQYELIEAPGYYALPGFVDTRIYGAGGYDSMRADTDRNTAGMSTTLAAHGVTTFLPTTQSIDRRRLLRIVEGLAEICSTPLPGAQAAGVHVEGPFLNREKHGAHPLEFLRPIDLEEARQVVRAGHGQIRVVTFAPEFPEAVNLTRLLVDNGIMPCLGHSLATEAQVRAVVKAGALRCSHIFNAMEALEQRRLTLAAVALIDDAIWVEMITDEVHIHNGMIELVCRCKEKGKIVAVSNAVEAAGLRSGMYRLGVGEIVVREGRAQLADGTIAGSVRFLDENYTNMLRSTRLQPEQTAACFTHNPALSIGLTDRGMIHPGLRADLVLLDHEQRVQMTFVAGELVYRRRAVQAAAMAPRVRA